MSIHSHTLTQACLVAWLRAFLVLPCVSVSVCVCARVPTRNISQDVERLFFGTLPLIIVPHIVVWGSCSTHLCVGFLLFCDAHLWLPSTPVHPPPSLTHNSLTHNFVTHTHNFDTHNSFTQLCHTTLSHTTLSHTALSQATLLHTTLSHTTLPHTHTFGHTHTQFGHTHNFVTHIHHTTLGDIDATSAWQAWHLRSWAGSGGALAWFGRQMSHAQLCHTGPYHTQLTPTTLWNTTLSCTTLSHPTFSHAHTQHCHKLAKFWTHANQVF